MATEAPAAFFSYSREDSEFALRLAQDLKAAGANVWLDQLDIAPGQRWDRSVEDALTNCPRMLVILSPSSVNSHNVLDEVSFALESQKTVIPVLYRDCAIPFRLRRIQHLDFKTDYTRGLRALLKALGVDQSPQPISPAPPAEPKESQPEVSDAKERERVAKQERRKAAVQAPLEEHKRAAEQARVLTGPADPGVPTTVPRVSVRAKEESITEAKADPLRVISSTDAGGQEVGIGLPTRDALLAVLQCPKAQQPGLGHQGYLIGKSLSPERLAKIRARVPNIPKDEEILAYIVATMWGGVGDGLAFTTRRIAWRNGQWNIPGGASKFGQLPYSEFPATKFKKMTGMEIDLGPGLGFNHAGWCTLTTAQILELLESIKALLIHKHA